jgi:hypothetical protein
VAMEGYGSEYPGGCSGSHAKFFLMKMLRESNLRFYVIMKLIVLVCIHCKCDYSKDGLKFSVKICLLDDFVECRFYNWDVV